MFSVIIPCYNVDRYLLKTLDSIRRQSFEDFEVIIINDGSIDNTKEIAQSYCTKDSRFSYYEHLNSGVSVTRNVGIKKAKNRYIYFLDADDYIEPDLLKNAAIIFSKYPDVKLYSFGYDFDKDGVKKKLKNRTLKGNCKLSSIDFLKLYLSKRLQQNMCSFIVKRDSISGITFDDSMAYGEDQAFQLRAIMSSKYVYYTSVVHFHYCIRDGSAMNSGVTVKNMDALKSLIGLRQLFANTDLHNYLNNYIVYLFVSLWISGIRQKGNCIYFRALATYSDVLNNLTLHKSYFMLVSYVFKILYINSQTFRLGFCGRSSNN